MWKLYMLVGASALAFAVGWRVDEWRHGAAEVKTITRTITVTRNLDHYIAVAGVAAQAAQDRIVAHTREAQQEIPKDVPTGSVADVWLGAGWLRNYNFGLGLPEGSGLADLAADQPAIRAANALSIIDGNNGSCLAYQDAYRRVLSAYDQVHDKINGFRP